MQNVEKRIKSQVARYIFTRELSFAGNARVVPYPRQRISRKRNRAWTRGVRQNDRHASFALPARSLSFSFVYI